MLPLKYYAYKIHKQLDQASSFNAKEDPIRNPLLISVTKKFINWL